MTSEKRIEWCDIYKGFMILFVVIGHSTSKFVPYIYQFHIAGFFFITGYTSRLRERTDTPFTQQFLKKTYHLLLPYLTLGLFCMCFFGIFQKAGILGSISVMQYPAGIQSAISELFHLRIYPDWLGAMWFLPVLWGSSIFVDLLARICKKDHTLLIISLLIAMYSIEYTLIKGGLPWNIHLAGIAQGFIVMGYFARKIKKEPKNIVFILIKLLLIILIWGIARQCFGLTQVVDWPSNEFNGIIDLFIPLMGILLTIYLSEFIAKGKFIKKLFILLGQNSMGIMCLHFIGFKIAYLLFMLLDKINFSSFRQLTPVPEIQNYWFLLTFIAVLFSVLVWKLLNNITIARILLGGENIEILIANIGLQKDIFEKNITSCYIFLVNLSKKLAYKFVKMRKLIIFLFTVATICVSAKCIKNISMNTGKINITFPHYYDNISFGNGWLDQQPGETYRWVDKYSECKIWLHNQNTLHIDGFIPENVQNMTTVKIYINGKETLTATASNGQQLQYDIDISSLLKKNTFNSVFLEFDGTRIPTEEEQDKRIFSALINRIEIH
ncbi:MAG: acyltransferase family protein [Eubacterium sp.]|nr:acyltransferase family protein [Eubacterium sp.]